MQKLRERIWTGRLAAASTVTAVFVLAGTLASLVDENGDTTRFASGTKVNGMDAGGLTVDEAKVRIEGFYADGCNLTIKERGGHRETIIGANIDCKVEIPEGLKVMLDAQNAVECVSGPDVDNFHAVAMTVTYNQEVMKAKIKALTLISGSGITVTSGTHIPSYEEGQPFSVISAVQGNNVDEAKTTEVITAAVKAGRGSVDVNSTDCYHQVNIWEADENLIALYARMNQYRDMSVNYVSGDEKGTLGGGTIAAWVTGGRDGVPTVDLKKITTFVIEMVSRRDMVGAIRISHTAAGKDMELTDPHDWKIGMAGEVQVLAALIQAGPATGSVDREPVYVMTTVSRMTPDWDNTYVEVDPTGQHVYMFQEGNLVWNVLCVTGNISKSYGTLTGTYSLTYKEKDRILRGAKKADETYEHESHVDHRMLFSGGIGSHGAARRSKFGGTISQTSGSRSCINLPPEKASVLYDLIYEGIPMLCYQ